MKIRLGVIFGGMSVEHEVSVISALQAINAADKEKYDISPIYISKDGRMFTGEKLFNVDTFKDMEKLFEENTQISLIRADNKIKMVKYPPNKLKSSDIGEIDVFLPVVHGTNCEDGSIQGLLENLNAPYCGCNVISSASGMDKTVMKKVLAYEGIPVAKGIDFSNRDYFNEKEEIIKKIEALSYPVIVKPYNLGSSVGVSKANDRLELEKGISEAFEFTGKVLVEECIQNLREINCSVLGDYKKAETSVCEEPISSGVLDYADKYLGNSKQKGMASLSRKVPADITKEQEEKINELALKTFKVLGCAGVSRIDFLMNDETKEIYVNEINTIPGSLSFYLWEKVGVSFKDLIDRLVEIAISAHKEKNEKCFTYEENILKNGSFGGAKGGSKGSKF
ncbi:MAG: D-alanine--D-alanine ligase [Clostridia bacterium]|nr:D-alanine--D-alanine ligase [Clostridia bacterium]